MGTSLNCGVTLVLRLREGRVHLTRLPRSVGMVQPEHMPQCVKHDPLVTATHRLRCCRRTHACNPTSSCRPRSSTGTARSATTSKRNREAKPKPAISRRPALERGLTSVILWPRFHTQPLSTNGAIWKLRKPSSVREGRLARQAARGSADSTCHRADGRRGIAGCTDSPVPHRYRPGRVCVAGAKCQRSSRQRGAVAATFDSRDGDSHSPPRALVENRAAVLPRMRAASSVSSRSA